MQILCWKILGKLTYQAFPFRAAALNTDEPEENTEALGSRRKVGAAGCSRNRALISGLTWCGADGFIPFCFREHTV